MVMEYKPSGVCSRKMVIDVEDGIVKSLEVIGGCHGNLQGIRQLVEGMKVEDVISRLERIRCRFKPTSCPDQRAQALRRISEKRPGAALAPGLLLCNYRFLPR